MTALMPTCPYIRMPTCRLLTYLTPHSERRKESLTYA